MSTSISGEVEDDRPQLLEKRTAAIIRAWDSLVRAFPEECAGCYLDLDLLRETTENYLNDRDAYKGRRRIEAPSKIRLFKVAGLVAASICKYHPVQFDPAHEGPRKSVTQNEMLALWHGLAVCGEPCMPDVLKAAVLSQHFKFWKTEFLALMRRKPDSAEAFIMIFMTFCAHHFPLVLDLNPEENGGASA